MYKKSTYCHLHDGIKCGTSGRECYHCGWNPLEEGRRKFNIDNGRGFVEKILVVDGKKKTVRFLVIPKRKPVKAMGE